MLGIVTCNMPYPEFYILIEFDCEVTTFCVTSLVPRPRVLIPLNFKVLLNLFDFDFCFWEYMFDVFDFLFLFCLLYSRNVRDEIKRGTVARFQS